MDSDKVGTDKETALFDGLEPSDITKKALEFCAAYQREARESEAVLAKLAEHDLLVPNEGRFTLPSGEVLTVNDFRVVDETRFNALDDAAFLDLPRISALLVRRQRGATSLPEAMASGLRSVIAGFS